MTREEASEDHRSIPCPHVLCLAGRQKGKVFELTGGKLTFGRARENDIPVRDFHVSRQHATLTKEGSVYRIRDLKSRNATFVNNAPIQEVSLTHGDEIRIADHRFVFLMTRQEKTSGTRSVEAEMLSDLGRGRTITIRKDLPPDRPDPASIADDSGTIPPTGKLLEHLDVLHDMARTMVEDVDQAGLLKAIADLLIHSFKAERASLLLEDTPGASLTSAACSYREDAAQHDLPLSRTIIDKVYKDRTSLLCTDASADDRLEDAHSVSGYNIRSVMCTPLINRDRFLGLVYLDNRSVPDEFDEEDLWLLRTLANQAAVVIENHRLLAGMRQQLRHLQERVEEGEVSIVGSSSSIRDVVATARKAADSNATILILGESGTGKEVLAKNVHRWSQRNQKPFVVVNCAALSEQLLQSDLFGHERGAFTGAVRQKKGRLELADGGTVFLDEIGEVRLDMQARLLRFLQEREFDRVGGTTPLKVDVRIIAASNRDLAEEVRQGRFREDLYYRLRVIEIDLPPLRRRKSDIPLLAKGFLQDCLKETGKGLKEFSRDALERLKTYDWPGNVRELRNVVERAVVLSTEEMIDAHDLGLGGSSTPFQLDSSLAGFHEQIKEFKKRVIQDALERSEGVQGDAAKRLGIQRTYLSRLMKNLGMR